MAHSLSKTLRKMNMEEGQSSQNSIIPTGVMSYRAAEAELELDGINSVIALEGLEPDQGVKDLAMEFQAICNGTIKTTFHVVTLSLRGRVTEKGVKLKMGSLSSVSKMVKKMFNLADTPFERFHKVQIFYNPLFTINSDKGSDIRIQLVDKRMKNKADQIKHECRVDISKTSISEFGMNYFVKTKDADKLIVRAIAENVPVKDDIDFGAVFMAFHTHHDFNPLKTEFQVARCLYIADNGAPVDVNRSTVLRDIGTRIKNSAKSRQLAIESKRMEETRRFDEMGDVTALEELAQPADVIILPSAPEIQYTEIGHSESNKAEIREKAMMEHNKAAIREKISQEMKGKWMFDTGASHHVYFHEISTAPDEMKTVSGEVIRGQLMNDIAVVISKGMVKLDDVFLTKGTEGNCFSWSAFKKQKSNAILSEKEGTITVFYDGDNKIIFKQQDEGKLYYSI